MIFRKLKMIYNYLERFLGVGKTSDTTRLQDVPQKIRRIQNIFFIFNIWLSLLRFSLFHQISFFYESDVEWRQIK